MYHSYLLRIWKEFQEEDCRASLQDVTSGECHYFANLPALMAFLQTLSDPGTATQESALSPSSRNLLRE